MTYLLLQMTKTEISGLTALCLLTFIALWLACRWLTRQPPER